MPPNLQLSSASSRVSKKGKSPAQKGQSWVLSFLSWRSSKKKETGPRAGSARSCSSCTVYPGEFRELYTDFGLWGNLKNVEPCPGHIALDAIDLIGDLPAATLGGVGHRPASYPVSYTDVPTQYLWPRHTSCGACSTLRPRLPLSPRITWLVEWVWECFYYPVSSPSAFSSEVLLYFALSLPSSLTPSHTHTHRQV